ncbi:MAG: DUF1295 domain-containing protein [Gammaproteobacteria bacterium]|nr:DUF1295 domain-containing protein [Gammaproteobacteria bacterium]MYC53918.1 DUF1295 domain-containing protein [Gammaproteobacteria bacterium]
MLGLDFVNLPLAGTPFGTALELCLVLALVAWLLSVITREVSWIDRLWSICPPVYCLIVAASVGFAAPRVMLMAALVVAWGSRLTYNFARKGGYRPGGEDYRWAYVRKQYGPVGFQVLSITLVHPGQMLLIWLFTSPIHQAWQFPDTPLGWLDFLAAAVFLTLLAGETIADRQMWDFQQDKKHLLAGGEEIRRPFMTRGLYRYSRHPNYFCELAMWWVFYLFAVAASGEWVHWTGLGCIGLSLLFVPSLRMTEEISAAKYPGYREYQAAVPALIPFLRKEGAKTAD